MSTNTPDQQITYPADADAADNPLAFNQFVADVEPRLVREYTTEADRTARMLALAANEISSLSAPSVGLSRIEAYDGTNHVSLLTRSFYASPRKTSNETVNNSTALQNDDHLLVALPTAGTFDFELDLYYSSSQTADIKFAFTIPAGATFLWGIIGPAVGNTVSAGDGNFATSTTSGGSLAVGGIAVGTILPARITGNITMGGTAGNLQLQWAQQALDATNTVLHARSVMRAWRVT